MKRPPTCVGKRRGVRKNPLPRCRWMGTYRVPVYRDGVRQADMEWSRIMSDGVQISRILRVDFKSAPRDPDDDLPVPTCVVLVRVTDARWLSN